MSERFKKGQMITKRLGLVQTNKSKFQHLCVFGADVEVNGKSITIIGDGSAIHIFKSHIGGNKGKPKEKGSFLVNGISVYNANNANEGGAGSSGIEIECEGSAKAPSNITINNNICSGCNNGIHLVTS